MLRKGVGEGTEEMRCKWKACVNNMSGECKALNKEITTKDGRTHVLDEDECPFYKPKPGMGMHGISTTKVMYFCDRTMCGDRCNRSCVYTPNVSYAVDPDGYPFSRSPKDGHFYQVPVVQYHRMKIEDVRNIIEAETKGGRR